MLLQTSVFLPHSSSVRHTDSSFRGENNETMNEYSCNMHTRVFLFLIIVLEVLMLKI